VALRSTVRDDAICELLRTFPVALCPCDGGWTNFFKNCGVPVAVDVANGVAIVLINGKAQATHSMAVGRCLDGFVDHESSRIIVAVAIGVDAKDSAAIILQLAALVNDPRMAYKLLRPQTLKSFRSAAIDLFRHGIARKNVSDHGVGDEFLSEAFRVAVSSNCSCILFFADAVCDWRPLLGIFSEMKCIVITENATDDGECCADNVHVLRVSSYSEHRLVQLRSAILLALSRDLLKMDEKVCCIGGLRGSGRLDSLLLVSVAEEYRMLLNARKGLIPAGVKPEVFERLVAIAHEIAMEGREGHPIGTMFVVGRHEHLRAHYRSLVLNPFQGYARHERNLLNPFMCETAKEFAALDGAFIIDGDGVLEAAGVMVDAPDSRSIALQSGFGTRHTAAAAFTRAYDCLVIVVSQSSGQVSLFRNGQMIALTGKIIG
ncbi:MAG: DNA integrity scanning protein DisA nucleotide-binding domain protein, partial [Puniceicoccales bacterium]|nr:DNA integrity scanning protein DisA nucleotide-binding domain protein [Puniceicoccales bacterium]